jgi:hypothetical protein
MNTPDKLRYVARVTLLSLSFLFQENSQGSGLDSDPSLKLHFDFEPDFSSGCVQDLSGNGNHGWQFDSTNWITATNGVFGSTAAQFNYVGFMSNDPPIGHPYTQYIAVTNLDGIAVLTNGTISVWAKFEVASNDHNLIYLLDNAYDARYARAPNDATNCWAFGRITWQNYLTFWVCPAGGYSLVLGRWPDDSISRNNPSTTRFHLYTITFDCLANRAVAYHDGVPCATSSIGVPWLRIYGGFRGRWLCVGAMSHDGTPQWGDDNFPNAGFFPGKMDDLRIYNRTLSAAEVQALYLGAGSAAQSRNLAIRTVDPQSFQLSWVGQSNVFYRVERRQDPAAGSWTAVGPAVLSAGGTDSVTYPGVGQPWQFFRVYPLP